MNFNRVFLGGNLTRDPELRYTPSNQSVVSFGLAINRKYTTSSGEKKDEVTFVDCEAWGKTAENIGQYFTKGRPIFVEGRLKLETWQTKEGDNRSKMKVIVDQFQFVGGESPKKDGKRQPHADHALIDDASIPF